MFYINHEIATISRNSTQGIYAPLPPQDLLEKYSNFGSNYYTVDYAELEDGSWRIIEIYFRREWLYGDTNKY